MIFDEAIKFIKRLQEADEATKKKWLIIMSGVTMVILIFFWLIYLKSAFVAIGPAPKEENQDSFWQTFIAGFSLIANQIKFWSQMGNEIMLQGTTFNFIPEEMEGVPPTPLP